MLRVAVPLTSGAVPTVIPPSLNATVPVGTPVAGATGLTVAVSVTACPPAEGFGMVVRVVVVDVDARTKIFPVTLKRLVWTTLMPGPPTLGAVGVGNGEIEVTNGRGDATSLVVREIDRPDGR